MLSVLTQQTAFAHGQTIYAFRQSLFIQSIPQNPLALQVPRLRNLSDY